MDKIPEEWTNGTKAWYDELAKRREAFGKPDVGVMADTDDRAVIYCPHHPDTAIYQVPKKWNERGPCCWGLCFATGGLHELPVIARCEKCGRGIKILFESYGG